MQQWDTNRIVRATLSGAFLTAASVCVGAGHVASAARIRGSTFSMERFRSEAYWEASSWLFISGATLFGVACVLAVLALLPARRQAA